MVSITTVATVYIRTADYWADFEQRIIGKIQYDTIRYDSVYLTCSKKLTDSQLSLPHRINKKIKCKTRNKMTSVIGPVQSRYREAVQNDYGPVSMPKDSIRTPVVTVLLVCVS